jgi:hypothetical protein
VFAAHMIGAAVAAEASGAIRSATGDYFGAWVLAGSLAILAGLACLAIPRSPTSTKADHPQYA